MSTSSSNPLCQTCSSQLTPSAVRQAFVPPCCRTPICSACIAANPRLREYIPCLRCGDLTTRDGESRVIQGRRAQEWKKADEEGGEVMFDANSDEDGDEIDALDDRHTEGIRTNWRSDVRSDSDTARKQIQSQQEELKAQADEEEEEEVVEVRHIVARSDTLLAIARRYAADRPHELLSLNNLPPTALSSNPRILQTRKSILITRRRVPKSQVATLQAIPDDAVDPEEVKRRQEERAVKRFQLVTKTVDPGVGKAYLSLQAQGSQGEDPHPLEYGSGEALSAEGGGKKKGNLSKEDRAVEQWFEDDEWEGESSNRLPKKKEGKWTSVGGSNSAEKTGWFGLKA